MKGIKRLTNNDYDIYTGEYSFVIGDKDLNIPVNYIKLKPIKINLDDGLFRLIHAEVKYGILKFKARHFNRLQNSGVYWEVDLEKYLQDKIIEESKIINFDFIQDMLDWINVYNICDPIKIVNYIWGQGSWCINDYKKLVPTMITVLEKTRMNFIQSKKLYRGILIPTDKDEYTLEGLEEMIINSTTNAINYGNYISTTEDLNTAFIYASTIGQYPYNTNKDSQQLYSVILEIEANGGIPISYNAEEKEVIVDRNTIKNIKVKSISQLLLNNK